MGTLAPGTTIVLRIGGHLDPAFTDLFLANTARFTSDANAAPVDSNATSTPVDQLADLAVTKVATQEAFAAGEQAVFTVTVTNDGPSTARALSLGDTLPPGTTLAGVTPAAPLTCTSLPCVVGDLAPGDSASIDVVVDLPASFPPGADHERRRGQLADPRSQPGPAHRPRPDQRDPQRRHHGRQVAGDRPDHRRAAGDVRPHHHQRRTLRCAGSDDQRRHPCWHVTRRGQHRRRPAVRGDRHRQRADRVVRGPVRPGQRDRDRNPHARHDAAITGNLRNTAVAGAQALDRFDTGNTSTAEALVQQIPPDTTTTTTTTTTDRRPATTTPTTTTVATADDGATTRLTAAVAAAACRRRASPSVRSSCSPAGSCCSAPACAPRSRTGPGGGGVASLEGVSIRSSLKQRLGASVAELDRTRLQDRCRGPRT